MSHASTASITLGGSAPAKVQPVGQPTGVQYGTPAPQPLNPQPSQASQGNMRRRRENVPDHMKHTVPGQPSSKGGMEFGSVYKPSTTNIQSSTPDQAYQTQTLFNAPPQPQVQQQGNTRYGITQPRPTPAPAPTPVQAPQPVQIQQVPVSVSEQDARRAEEARQKLLQLNLPPEVVEQYRRKFKVLDLNKDGVVNLREFAAISRVLGYKFSKEEILELFGRRDLDDSGGISFDEFVIAMYERAQKTKQLAPYREKFRLYDWKGRGYITSDEAYPVLKKELGFDENKTEMMIDMFDRNKDYRLSLLEFIDFYKKVEELKVQVRNAFQDFDRNGDGYVDANEAKAVLIPKGFTDPQVDSLIYKYDLDRDGRLNYGEFAAFWDVQLV